MTGRFLEMFALIAEGSLSFWLFLRIGMAGRRLVCVAAGNGKTGNGCRFRLAGLQGKTT